MFHVNWALRNLQNTEAHNCHGKRNNLTAKGRNSRLIEKDSRQKKNLTTKRKDSLQKKTKKNKKKPHAKKKTHGKIKNLTAKEITMSSRHKRERGAKMSFGAAPWD